MGIMGWIVKWGCAKYEKEKKDGGVEEELRHGMLAMLWGSCWLIC